MRLLLLILTSLITPLALADACDVTTRSQSAAVQGVETHTCYHYEGMPADAISWSCSNESQEMLSSKKKRVESCDDNYVATCHATLTQEALANPRATSKNPDSTSANLPSDGRILTYYYDTADLKQARLDCESDGGKWQEK
jgi:hypothetical protein